MQRLRRLAQATRSLATAAAPPVRVHNPEGTKRVVVTKDLPGQRWLDILTASGCRVEVCTSADTILSTSAIKALLGARCDGVIGQLTERWDAELFGALRAGESAAASRLRSR
jgi:hydroxypyruvate reductase 1